MNGLHFMKARVTGQGAENANAQFIKQWLHVPEFTGDIELTNQGHVVTPLGRNRMIGWPRCRFSSADHFIDHHFTGNTVT